MAITINGSSDGAPWNHRIPVGVDASNYVRAYEGGTGPGEVLRAYCNFDNSGTVTTIDDPTQNNGYGTTTGQRIFPIGMEYAVPAADSTGCKLTFFSKVGVAAAIQLGTFPLNTYGGMMLPINVFTPFSITDQGGALQISTDAALYFVLHYVIADTMRPNYLHM